MLLSNHIHILNFYPKFDFTHQIRVHFQALDIILSKTNTLTRNSCSLKSLLHFILILIGPTVKNKYLCPDCELDTVTPRFDENNLTINYILYDTYLKQNAHMNLPLHSLPKAKYSSIFTHFHEVQRPGFSFNN